MPSKWSLVPVRRSSLAPALRPREPPRLPRRCLCHRRRLCHRASASVSAWRVGVGLSRVGFGPRNALTAWPASSAPVLVVAPLGLWLPQPSSGGGSDSYWCPSGVVTRTTRLADRPPRRSSPPSRPESRSPSPSRTRSRSPASGVAVAGVSGDHSGSPAGGFLGLVAPGALAVALPEPGHPALTEQPWRGRRARSAPRTTGWCTRHHAAPTSGAATHRTTAAASPSRPGPDRPGWCTTGAPTPEPPPHRRHGRARSSRSAPEGHSVTGPRRRLSSRGGRVLHAARPGRPGPERTRGRGPGPVPSPTGQGHRRRAGPGR